jgi:hypothetical protein
METPSKMRAGQKYPRQIFGAGDGPKMWAVAGLKIKLG